MPTFLGQFKCRPLKLEQIIKGTSFKEPLDPDQILPKQEIESIYIAALIITYFSIIKIQDTARKPLHIRDHDQFWDAVFYDVDHGKMIILFDLAPGLAHVLNIEAVQIFEIGFGPIILLIISIAYRRLHERNDQRQKNR